MVPVQRLTGPGSPFTLSVSCHMMLCHMTELQLKPLIDVFSSTAAHMSSNSVEDIGRKGE